MDADKLSFLDDEPETTDAEAPEQPPEDVKAEEAPEATEEPAEVEGKGETEKEAAPPAASDEKTHGNVPLAALLDEREKRQKLEREAEELRRWRQQYEAQQTQQQRPDFFDNPEAALSQVQQQFQAQLVGEKLKQSRFLAEREYGAELVQEAYAYFDANPAQSHALLGEPSPFHAAVEHYRKAKLADEIGNDPEAYKARLRAELEAEIAQKAPQKPAAPPRSLASAPGAGGETMTPGSAFDQLFG